MSFKKNCVAFFSLAVRKMDETGKIRKVERREHNLSITMVRPSIIAFVIVVVAAIAGIG